MIRVSEQGRPRLVRLDRRCHPSPDQTDPGINETVVQGSDQCGVCSAISITSRRSGESDTVIDNDRQDLGGVNKSADPRDSASEVFDGITDEIIRLIEVEA
ncbi:hypothetical protein GCM10009764_64730 [Nocardia ninae]|uniref:Uncharacterized protein n=1 Tax=Nocardia ninae NBRC 108245 TaxID=1210091 RepID=A0A511MDX6_9NOCA|nr:hypothetical protein NN4_33740 [Nocardia ninae NBRC 108245]